MYFSSKRWFNIDPKITFFFP
ncbi:MULTISPECIES: tryptophanase leader peptide [Pelistega]